MPERELDTNNLGERGRVILASPGMAAIARQAGLPVIASDLIADGTTAYSLDPSVLCRTMLMPEPQLPVDEPFFVAHQSVRLVDPMFCATLVACDISGLPSRRVFRSKNQSGIWWSWSWRHKRKIPYRVSRRPIRGPQFRTEPYRRSCLSNFDEYRLKEVS